MIFKDEHPMVPVLGHARAWAWVGFSSGWGVLGVWPPPGKDPRFNQQVDAHTGYRTPGPPGPLRSG